MAVYGGREAGSDEYEIGSGVTTPQRMPSKGIRVKTTVVQTISDRVDWQDELF